jgi:hypothetical protein
MNKIIKLSTLVEKKACTKQVDLFRKMFGEQVELTLELTLDHAQNFSVDWCAEKLLTFAALKAYNEATGPVLKAYAEATGPAWKAYDEATATALKAYDETKATAWKAYAEATGPASKAYAEATGPAREAYNETKATAFFNLYDGDVLQ